MALPSSNLSFSAIGAALCTPQSAPYSLRTMSAAAGFSTPDSVSEFFGYSCTYTISLSAQCQTSAGVNAAGFYYRINGGTAVFIKNTTISTSPSYSSITTSISINPTDIIDFWVRNTGNTANYTFGSGNNSGTYTGFCGVGSPYTVTPTGNTTYYLNLRVVSSAFVTC
jgi:hypothetical protein